jgi:hypothetical protein
LTTKGTSLGQGGVDIWIGIRRENISNGIFFPAPLQTDFKTVVRRVLMMDDLSDATAEIDVSLLERLRGECVTYIEREYK